VGWSAGRRTRGGGGGGGVAGGFGIVVAVEVWAGRVEVRAGSLEVSIAGCRSVGVLLEREDGTKGVSMSVDQAESESESWSGSGLDSETEVLAV
jgi:hypothetical protein